MINKIKNNIRIPYKLKLIKGKKINRSRFFFLNKNSIFKTNIEQTLFDKLYFH